MKTYYFLLILIVLSFVSCKSGNKSISDIFSSQTEINQNNVQEFISNNQQIDSSNAKILNAIYEKNGNKAFWVDDEVVSKELLSSIESMKYDGILLNTDSILNTIKKGSDATIDKDLSLSYLFILAANQLSRGKIIPQSVDTNFHIERSKAIHSDSFFQNDKLKILDNFRPDNIHYNALRKLYQSLLDFSKDTTLVQSFSNAKSYEDKIAFFEKKYNLSVNGSIDSNIVDGSVFLEKVKDKILLNMERYRWIPISFPKDYIHANVPQMQLDYIKDSKSIFNTRTIVGARSTKTPSLIDTLENIVFNPPWTVPFSIVQGEMRGRISRKYKVFKGGKVVPNGVVNINNYKRYTVQQPAGPGAALGYLKFNMPNRHHIYLHDTPNRNLFGNKKRALSHGCVRVQNPRAFASLILTDKGYTEGKVDSAIAKGKTFAVNTDKILVFITYHTAGVDYVTNKVTLYNDIYSLDDKLSEQLKAKL